MLRQAAFVLLLFQQLYIYHFVKVRNGQDAHLNFDLEFLSNLTDWFIYVIDPHGNTVLAYTSTGVVELEPKYKSMYNIMTSNTSLDLTILGTNKSQHAGTFTCRLNHQRATKPSYEANLTVTDKPSQPEIQLRGTPVFGHPTELDCVSNSTTLPPNNNMYLNYTWFRYKQRLHNGSLHTIIGSRLLINELERHDTYEFECLAKEDNMESPLAIIKFSPEYGPQSISVSKSWKAKAEEGSDMNISCNATCKPRCYYEWDKAGEALRGTREGFLRFSTIARENAGPYSCNATNVHGWKQKKITLDILYATTFLKRSKSKSSKTINEGQDVVLNCDVDSNPAPYVSWLKDGISLKEKSLSSTLPRTEIENGVTKHVYDNVYVKPKAECSDRGIYTCQAKNGIGAIAQETMEISVFCSVRYEDPSGLRKQYTTHMGNMLNVTVNVISFPKPKMLGWKHVKNKEDHVIGERFRSSTATKPSGYEHILTLHHPKLKTEDKGNYRVELSNGIGKSLTISYAIIVQVPPEEPVHLTVLYVENTYVGMKWEKGFDGYAKQWFEVSFIPTNEDEWHVDSMRRPGNSTSAVLHNLKEGTEYRMRVRAINDVGSSGYSDELRIQTKGTGIAIGPKVTNTELPSVVREDINEGSTSSSDDITGIAIGPKVTNTELPSVVREDIKEGSTSSSDDITGSLFTATFFGVVGCSIVILVACYVLLKGPLRFVVKGRTMPNGRHQSLHPEVAEVASFERPEHIYEEPGQRLSTPSVNSYLHATPTRYMSLKRIHDQDSEIL